MRVSERETLLVARRSRWTCQRFMHKLRPGGFGLYHKRPTDRVCRSRPCLRPTERERAPVSSCSVTIGLFDRPVKELRDDGREVERTVDNGDDR